MVEIFCLVCADIQDIDYFNTAVKPPHDKPFDLLVIKTPHPIPRDRIPPLVRYKQYSNTDMGIGVCYSCSNAIQKIKEK